MNNIVYIAAAGSGKTTKLIESSCEVKKDQYVLFLTYTDSNEREIREKFYKMKGCIPPNVFIQSWFSFLIQHFIKPYQNYLTDDNYKIEGLAMSHVASKSKQNFYAIPKEDWKRYYFTSQQRVITEKLSELAFECNIKSENRAINRISNIFENIYIDEVQDLAGYDFELIRLLFNSNSNVILAGDPRQMVYKTNHGRKNSNFKSIIDFLDFNSPSLQFKKDEVSLKKSYRCCSEICDYASLLSPEFPKMESSTNYEGVDCDVFLVKEKDKENFLKKNNLSMQLRYRIDTKGIEQKFGVMNFGESKGLTFESVLIYPTAEMKRWVENHEIELKEETRNKFYVAVTRAKYQVGIVWNDETCSVKDIDIWKNK